MSFDTGPGPVLYVTRPNQTTLAMTLPERPSLRDHLLRALAAFVRDGTWEVRQNTTVRGVGT